MFKRSLLAGLIFAAGAQFAHADMAWEQYQGGAAHTGYSATTLMPAFSPAWQKSFGVNINPVTSTDGSVFVSTQGYFSSQSFFALDSANGNVQWFKDFGAIFSVNPPSYANGVVYLQTGNHSTDTYLRAYKAQTGDLVFKSPHQAQWERYGAPTLYGGNVFVSGGYYGGAYSFNATTGDERWFQNLEQYDGWTPAVDASRVVTYTGGNLRVLSPETGAVTMTINDPSFSWAGWTHSMAPVLAGEHAYVSVNNRLAAFDLTNGDMGWVIGGVAGQPAVDGAELFTIRNGSLASLNALTGTTNWLWEDSANSALSGEVVVTQNLVLVSSATKTYAIDRTSHQAVQTLDVGGRLALGEGQLYVASGSTLYAYDVTVVPEPASWLLMLAGAWVVISRARLLRRVAMRPTHCTRD